MTNYTIWSSRINLNDWSDYLQEEFPGVTDEMEQYEICSDMNNSYIGDERANLDIDTDGKIVCIANLGLWNGRRSGYKEISYSIADCLHSDAYDVDFEVDRNGDMRATEYDHDGTSYLLFRELKPELSDAQIEHFYNLILSGDFTRRDINRYTRRIGDKIAAVYGWKVRKARSKANAKRMPQLKIAA